MTATRGSHLDAVLPIAAALTVLRVVVSCLLGPGDSEALYALYARHLAPGYLDHAPLIGWLQHAAERLGTTELGVGIGLPHGLVLRIVPIACWIASLLATRDLARTLWPDDAQAANRAAVAFIVCPLFLVGGMAASPDAPMSAAWLGSLAFAARAMSPASRPDPSTRVPCPRSAGSGSVRDGHSTVGAGALLGIAFLAKYSAALLGLAFVLALASRQCAPLLRRPTSWIAATIAFLLASPPLVWNATHDWASIRHRLDWTQSESGLSLRNLGAWAGGQILYLTPLVAVVGIAVLLFLWRNRARSAAHRLVALATFVPMVPLSLLCLWSSVAEPHWMLPVWLALPAVIPGALALPDADRPWALRTPSLRWAAGSGLALVAILHLHVLTDLAPRLLPASLYDPRFDLAHDLRGWPEVASRVEHAARRARTGVALALHWTTCAQLDLALRARRSTIAVGCLTPERDDYDDWAPELAARADAIVVVDGRWTDAPHRRMPLPSRGGARRLDVVRIERGGRVVRTFELWR